MTLIAINGDVGSGKTLLATYLAMKDERKVLANYTMKIPNWEKLTPEKLVKIDEPALVILDESYAYLESRLSGRDVNRFYTYILFQSRKRGIDIITTEQLYGTVDLRFRQMTNIEIYSEYQSYGFKYKIFTKSFSGYRGPSTVILPYEVAEKIFPLYDTYEMIDAFDDDMMLHMTQDKSEIISEVDKIVDSLLEKAPPKAYTKGIISDYVLRNDLPKSYTDMVYNSIKARSVTQDA